MLSFKVIFLAVVIAIFTLFAIGAHKAEIVVAREAKENREKQATKVSAAKNTSTKSDAKSNKRK